MRFQRVKEWGISKGGESMGKTRGVWNMQFPTVPRVKESVEESVEGGV